MIDLSRWSHTGPLDANGKMLGEAVIRPSSTRDRFLEGMDDGSVVFRVPTDGATTKNSHYPRSELRELDANGKPAAWSVQDGCTIEDDLVVFALPLLLDGSMGSVVVGQFHGEDDERCRVYVGPAGIGFHDDKADGKHEAVFPIYTGPTLGKRFRMRRELTPEKLVVTITLGGKTYSAENPHSAFWLKAGKVLYAKTGPYCQVGKPGSGAGHTGTGWAKARFFSIGMPSHMSDQATSR